MKGRKYKYFVGDFETTVFEGQEYTEVWASACVEFYSEDVKICHSIEEQFEYFKSLNANIICYYHNLKFDGEFWLSFLVNKTDLKQSTGEINEENINETSFGDIFRLENNTYCYSVSGMGVWYRIMIKVNNKVIEFRDSLKLLPFSVKRIGKAFKTKHQKLDMEYKGYRYAGCEITEEEQKYIANDVLVIKEALEIMYKEGNKKLTIGSCCLTEFIKSIGFRNYEKLFPPLYEIPLDKNIYGSENAGEWLRKSYRGGWCYAVKGKTHKELYNGTTADVNSLYPSMMSSESGNKYPVGKPTFWSGNYIPNEALLYTRFYFVRIKTRFYLKPGFLPFIQIKSSMLYKANESLESSDVFYKGRYYDKIVNLDGKIVDTSVELTLTMTDYELIKKHYELVDFEILDGCYFEANIGVFDEYINKYKKIKLESKGAMRELAKLFLNNLYGKMASGTNSNFKVALPDEDGVLKYFIVRANDKTPGYIAVGSAITSYARRFTITAAQRNFYGADKPGFVYADTDSIHCDLQPDQIKGITVHDKNFCCWKLESCWDIGYFVRQKTYIEHITAENLEEVEKPYYNVKCAGMPEKCKNLFVQSLTGMRNTDGLTEEEKDFVMTDRKLSDFDIGLIIPGKLLPKRIRGGVVLTDTYFTMR